MYKKGKSRIVAVIPAYNEENTIENTINALKKISLVDDIVVVDDGSSDNTWNIINEMNIQAIRLNENHGKGYAIKEALKKIDFNYLVLVDGDLGETSSEIEKLIYPVIENVVDVSIAKFPQPKKKGGFGFVKKLARYGVYKYTGTKINTSLSGQRVYNKKVIDNMCYIPDRFGVEVAMTVETLRMGYTVGEIDVNMSHRETGRSIRDFIHRGKQFLDIFVTLIKLKFKG